MQTGNRFIWIVLVVALALCCCTAAALAAVTALLASSGNELAIQATQTTGFESGAEPRQVTFRYQSELVNIGPETVTRLEVWQGIPQDYLPYQKLLRYTLEPDTYEVVTGPDTHQSAYFNFTDLDMRPGDSITTTLTGSVLLYEHHEDLQTCPGPVPAEFQQPEKYIEADDPQIVNLADGLKNSNQDTCQVVRSNYDYVIDNVAYHYYDEDRGALEALESGEGDCTDMSFLLIALNRASGIPSRQAQGLTLKTEKNGKQILERHQWAEVYFPGTGWAPVDPTFGQNESEPYTYFGGQVQEHVTMRIDGWNLYYTWWSETSDNQFQTNTTVELLPNDPP
jgi:transglutaminase-like putative cysteine protease